MNLGHLTADIERQLNSISNTTSVSSYVGFGDPSNVYHAVKQFLLSKGIDTRIFSWGIIPLPRPVDKGTSTSGLYTVDNAFFFEFRKVVQVSADVKINTLVLLGRVFFENDQNDGRFHVQLVPNHEGDCIYELNVVYSDVFSFVRADGWKEVRSTTRNQVPLFERSYSDQFEFQRFINALLSCLGRHGIFGNGIAFPTQPPS